jgi:hypothetical protein
MCQIKVVLAMFLAFTFTWSYIYAAKRNVYEYNVMIEMYTYTLNVFDS